MFAVPIGSWQWHPGTEQLTRADEQVKLTPLEANLLGYLAGRPGDVVSARELLTHVWEYHERSSSRAVAHTVARLRRKLGTDGKWLETVYGEGYRLLVQDVGDLVGRGPLLAQARRALEEAHVLTLHGMGGVGKSRLARAMVAQFPDHVWVPASPIRGEDAFLAALALLLQLPADQHAPAGLGAALAERGVQRLVIDAAENLDAWLLALAHQWVEQHPSLRVLITSRVLLGEGRWLRVEPLDESDAVRLFLRHGAVVAPGTSVTEDVARAVVRAIDGLPLAIELAAARLRVLDPTQLWQRMQANLGVLGGGDRGVDGALAESWTLLSDAERRTLAAGALLVDPFSIDDLVEVTGYDVVTVLDALDGLVRAALVVHAPPGFRLLDLVRAYGKAQADGPLQSRFAAWAAAQAASMRQISITSPGAAEATLLKQGLGYRAALEVATQPVQRAHLTLAYNLYERLVGGSSAPAFLHALNEADLPPALQIDVLLAQSRHQSLPKERPGRGEGTKRALRLAREHGTVNQISEAWRAALHAQLLLEGAEAVIEPCGELLAFVQSHEVHPAQRASAMAMYADLQWRQQAYDEALLMFENALPRWAGHLHNTLHGQTRLSIVHRYNGRPDLARAWAQRALDLANASRQPPAQSSTQFEMMQVLADLDDVDAAKAIAQELRGSLCNLIENTALFFHVLRLSLEDTPEEMVELEHLADVARARGNRRIEGVACTELAYQMHVTDRLDEAVVWYQRAGRILDTTDFHYRRGVAAAWRSLALHQRGSTDQAHATVKAHPAMAGLAGRVLDQAREALGLAPERPHHPDLHHRTVRRTARLIALP